MDQIVKQALANIPKNDGLRNKELQK